MNLCEEINTAISEVRDPDLKASSSSLEGIEKMTSEYFMGSDITLKEIGKNLWSVSNAKGLLDKFEVVKKAKRFKLMAKG